MALSHKWRILLFSNILIGIAALSITLLVTNYWYYLFLTIASISYTLTLLILITTTRSQSNDQKAIQIYREAIQATPYAFALYDKNDVLFDHNLAYEEVHKNVFASKKDIIKYEDVIRASYVTDEPEEVKEKLIAQRVAFQRTDDGEPVDRHYPDGRWLRVSKHKTKGDAVVGYGIDITDLKLRELELVESERQYTALTQVAPVGIWQIGQQGNTLFVNQALLNIFSCRDEQEFEQKAVINTINLYINNQPLSIQESQNQLLNGDMPKYLDAKYSETTYVGNSNMDDNTHDSNEKFIYIARGKLLEHNDGDHSYMLVVVDVTERKKAERDIRYLAEHDSLTTLANRSSLNKHLQKQFSKGECFALALLDLDKFKQINDSLGHQTGDDLLQHASSVIKSGIREQDFASRFGGDEFAIVLNNITSHEHAHKIISRVYEDFKKPFFFGRQWMPISASSGIAIFPEHGKSAQELIQNADIALYHQKKIGRGSFTIFDNAIAEEINKNKRLENDLRRALNNHDELTVYYQPQYCIASSKMLGVEALVRWRNARTGAWVPPIDFISIAEQSGLIYQLDKFVLTTAAKQVNDWHNKYDSELKLCGNLSSLHFHSDTLSTMINDVLHASRIDPHTLEIEITESLFLEDKAQATEQLKQFRELGIRVAVDDFGTGYSNLGYLNNLPVDTLKIDRSFIDNFHKDDYHHSLVHFIIELGNKLELNIIAEGIETAEQLEALKALGCAQGQGYFLAKPQPKHEIEDLLSKET